MTGVKTPSQRADFLRELILMTLGTLAVVCGVYFFKFPNNFSTGGVSGISVILGALVPSSFFTPATAVLVINGALLIVGFLVFGRGFGFKTVYCSALMSLALRLFEVICPMTAPLTDQPLLELCFAVMLPAVGSAILFGIGATTGGTDIVAMILRRYTALDIGKSLACVDIAIVVANAFVFGVRTGLFSALGLICKALVVDSVIENINLSKYFLIVTSEPEKVCGFINTALVRGATVWECSGSFTHNKSHVVLTAMKRSEAARLRAYIREVDPGSFVVISDTSNIIGKGFRSPVM